MGFLYISAFFLVFAVLVSLLHRGYKHLWNRFIKEFINKYLLLRPLSSKYRDVLEKHSKYYQELGMNDQKLFRRRVQKFIGMKEFIPRGELVKVTAEMKALIAATAIQITFGYPHVYFEHFWRILLYEDSYYSPITQSFHKGEVNMAGIIVLSWKNYVKGFVNNDGTNLGIHEMAHALHFENAIMNGEYAFIDQNVLNEFHRLSTKEINHINGGGKSLFREYAAVNYQEFFAVVIENFFERPEEFYQYNKDLFESACRVLKQDTRK